MVLLLLFSPLVPAALAAVIGWRTWVGWVGTAASAVVVGAGVALAAQVATSGPLSTASNIVRVDALSAFMIIVIGSVALLSSWFATAYIDAEIADGQTSPGGARLYAVLVEVFIAAMVLAVVANNLGVMWVAIEATTIASAFLIGHRRTTMSFEASWKYVLIGSVGVALAFLGTALVYFASRRTGGPGAATLDWQSLAANAGRLDPGVIRVAAGLLVLGFGTKAGLAPLHTGLPDAYSQAPAPVAALMSGALVSVAFYAVLRYKVIIDGALGPGFMRHLLTGAALLSLAVAASLLIVQRNYKRMLAYSSIEHMGFLALGAAAGTPLAIAAVLLHILGHGLVKSVLFLGSGEILRTEGTTEIDGVHGLLARRPVIGGTFGLGLLALLGMPPFSLFASEVGIARAGFAAGLGWEVAVAMLLVLVIFASVVIHGQRMLLGDPDTAARPPTSWQTATPLIGGLLASAAIGLSAWPLDRLLRDAAGVLVRG